MQPTTLRTLTTFHAVLFFAYTGAIWIGLVSTIRIAGFMIYSQPFSVDLAFQLILILAMFIGGMFGTVWHWHGWYRKEVMIIPAVIMGYLITMVDYIHEIAHAIELNLDVSSATGLYGGLMTVMIVYLVHRYTAIRKHLLREKANSKAVYDADRTLNDN